MTRLQDVWQEIVITRIRGYAMESQEGQEGVSCLAVPLLRGGNPICAVSVTAPIDRMNRARVGQLAATIRAILTPRLPTGLSLPTLSSPAVPAETVT
jgi:DNA-binding IclR family transcriptional regulator